MSREITWIV